MSPNPGSNPVPSRKQASMSSAQGQKLTAINDEIQCRTNDKSQISEGTVPMLHNCPDVCGDYKLGSIFC